MAGFVRVSGYSKTDLDNAYAEGYDEGIDYATPAQYHFRFRCTKGEGYQQSWFAPKSGTLVIDWAGKVGPGDSGWDCYVGNRRIISDGEASEGFVNRTTISVTAGQRILVTASADSSWFVYGELYMMILS